MKLPRRRFWVPLALVLVFVAFTKFDLHYHIIGWFRGDAYYRGLPTTYWRDAAMLQSKGPGPLREKLHRWARMPLPLKDDQFPLFRGDSDAMPVLTQFVDDEATDKELRLQAMITIRYSVGQQQCLSTEIKDALLRWIDSADRDIRFIAAREMLRFNAEVERSAKVMWHVITEQLNDPSPFERISATYRLHELGNCKQVDLAPILRKLQELDSDSDRRIRIAASEVIDSLRKSRDDKQ